ncbi:MAG: glycosyl hydrolase [Planctomycetaceae bacterium]|nr:glycosyl hydrolase [Planctomycetaceae bacterium]
MRRLKLMLPVLSGIGLWLGVSIGALAGDLSKAEKAEGFVSLFNGKTLDGWIGSTKGYIAENGLLVCRKKGGGNLLTAKQYADFVLRFEFRLPPGGNNGLAIRTPRKGNPAYVGMELQILDNTSKRYAKLKPYQYHGSIYGVVAALRGHLKPVGEWNQQEVIARGTKIRVVLNGTTIVDADLKGIKPLDGRKHAGLSRKSGHLGFMGHGARIDFRHIRLKDLAAK